MKPTDFQYHAPRTLEEALAILGEHEDARPLAGGQSLMPMMNLRLAAPEHLVDLNRIKGLAGVKHSADGLQIRAMTRQRDVEHSALIGRACPLLIQALNHVGHQQTRNRGTIGGSIAHQDPSAELPVAAAALDATVDIAGPSGVRTIHIHELANGYLSTQIAPDELLIAIRLPAQGARTGTDFTEVARRPADFAIVSVASIVEFGDDNIVRKIAVSIGGLDYAPVRLRAFEASAAGVRWDESLVTAAEEAAREQPAEDKGEYSAAYCSHLAGILVGRSLRKAAARAAGGHDAAHA